MAMVISNTFDFNSTGYYYNFDKGTGTSTTGTTNYIAKDYRGYASYWAYSASAIYDKHVSSVILRITSDSNKYSSSVDLSFCFACAALSSTDNATKNIILRKNRAKFGAHTQTYKLPKGASKTVDVDVTNVIKYAAENYNKAWGLYIIGGEFDGAYNDGGVGSIGSNGVAVLDPTFITCNISSAILKIHNGSSWVDGVPYIHNGSSWVQAKAIYRHNGSSWVQI